MAGKKDAAFMRWDADEYRRVAANALGYLEQGLPLARAFKRAQVLALASRRHRSTEELERLSGQNGNTLQKYVDAMRALKPEELAPFLVTPKAEPKPASKTGRVRAVTPNPKGTRVDWTTLEKARVARELQQLRAAGDGGRSLSTLVIIAQQTALPRDRWRASTGIHSANYVGALKRDMDEGARNIWMLDEAPPIEATPAPQQPASEPQAPQAAPRASSGLADAARVFAETLQGALGTLLQAQASHLLGQLEAHTANVAQSVAQGIAAHIQQSLQSSVHDLIAAELGGPVATPPAAPAPAAAPEPEATQEAARPKRVKVDIVGLLASQAAEVKKAFNGTTDLLFVETTQAKRWTPRPGAEVVINTKWISHSVEDRCRVGHVKPVRVSGGPSAFIHAIEELHRAQGIPTH
jgi:hypothetical protein